MPTDSKRAQQAVRLAAIGTRPKAPAPGARVWLLEDSHLQAEQTRRALEGWDVLHFLDGASLLDSLADATPDVLILDWELPGISGLEVLRVLRESHDEVTLPVLVVTGTEISMLDALSAGANDFVTRPCEDGVLRARLRT